MALELLKNANIAAGMVLPGCQDTGTAIIMGKRGQVRSWLGKFTISLFYLFASLFVIRAKRASERAGEAFCVCVL